MSMLVFQQKLVTTTTQMVLEVIDIFNAASGGALVLGTSAVLKDTIEKLSFGLIDGLTYDRNPYAAPGTAQDHKVLAQLLTNAVNGSLGIGPVTINDTLANKILTTPEQAAAIVATQAAQVILRDFVGIGVGAASGAIEAGSTTFSGLKYTQTAPVAANLPAGSLFPKITDFPLACVPWGDRQEELGLWIMSGSQWLNFIAGQAAPSAEQVFAIGNFKIMNDGLGKKFLISDAASTAAGGAILGLTNGAVALQQNGLRMKTGDVLGEHNMRTVWQGELDYSVAVKGYKATAALIAKAQNGTIARSDFKTKTNWELNAAPVIGATAADDDGMILPADRIQGQKVKQNKPKIDIKETAGVKVVLTASVQSAPTTP